MKQMGPKTKHSIDISAKSVDLVKTKSGGSKADTVYDSLKVLIQSGQYARGVKFPTQQILAKEFGTSRPTIIQALKKLENEGLVENRRGAGTFVKVNYSSANHVRHNLITYLAPIWLSDPSDFNGTVFGSMAPLVAQYLSEHDYTLQYSESPTGTTDTEIIEDAWRIFQKLIELKVAGVIYTPLILKPANAHHNEVLLQELRKNNIAVILLDRDICNLSSRSQYDLVGLDNISAGYEITRHLLEQGCTKIDFLDVHSETTVSRDRILGYQRALVDTGISLVNGQIHRIEDNSDANIEEFLKAFNAQALIAINDAVATKVLLQLYKHGADIPQEIKIAGFDDVPASCLLVRPLTTIKQPTQTLARAITQTLVNRINHPDAPTVTYSISGELIVRDSTLKQE